MSDSTKKKIKVKIKKTAKDVAKSTATDISDIYREKTIKESLKTSQKPKPEIPKTKSPEIPPTAETKTIIKPEPKATKTLKSTTINQNISNIIEDTIQQPKKKKL